MNSFWSNSGSLSMSLTSIKDEGASKAGNLEQKRSCLDCARQALQCCMGILADSLFPFLGPVGYDSGVSNYRFIFGFDKAGKYCCSRLLLEKNDFIDLPIKLKN